LLAIGHLARGDDEKPYASQHQPLLIHPAATRRRFCLLIRGPFAVLGDPGDPEAITLAAFNPAAERISGPNLADSLARPLAELAPETGAHSEPHLRRRPEQLDREIPVLRFIDGAHRNRMITAKAFPLPGARVGLALEDVSAQGAPRISRPPSRTRLN
jgi:hypothetical protein